MAATKKLTTTVTTKGQVVLPQTIRQRRWQPGTQLIVEDTDAGVLLKPAPLFPPTRPTDVFGSLRHAGPPKTLEQMQAGIAREARRRMLAIDLDAIVPIPHR
ncbi:MAG TPA: AbrB/MazE/SpoVT family DNA-binding domain-containing protein [Xanthobacteraceae bacterium]|jgi:AbrB family looped-hinge helix DNA binding protein